MRRALPFAAAGCVALAIALACGDVPTAPGGVTAITPILASSPTVAFGDTLRDSLGRATPLRVYALGRDSTDTVRDVTLRFLLTSLRSGARIDQYGYLIAPESLTTVRVVAQVTRAGSELQLQTPELVMNVVPLADSLAATTPPTDTTTADPLRWPLSVTVRGLTPAGRAAVEGIRVGFRVSVFPQSLQSAGRNYLTDDGDRVLRPDSTIAIDTTSSGGFATRTFNRLLAPAGEPEADSVVITASARSQTGVPLRGSPVRFIVRARKN